MTIIQATRHPMNFAQFSGDVLAGNAGITAWDAAYVKMLLRSNQSGGVAWRHIFRTLAGASLPLTDHWHQIEWWSGGPQNANGSVRFAFTNAAGQVLFRNLGTGSNALQYWNGSAFVTFATHPVLSSGVVYTWSWRYFRDATAGIIECYLNGTLIGGFYGNTVISSGGPTYLDMWNLSTGSGAGATDYWSGAVLTTGDENPWGIKVKTHVLTADGTYTGMVGPYTNVDDIGVDTADIISSSAAGQKRSMVIDDLPTLGGSDVVRGIYISAMARRGGTGPTGLQLGTLMSGADQLAPVRTLSTGWKVYNEFIDTNTVTGDEPTPAEVNAAQLLLQSAA